MALVLDHSINALAISAPSMHPFFRIATQDDSVNTVQQQQKTSSTSTSQSYGKYQRIPISFDGANDDENINLFHAPHDRHQSHTMSMDHSESEQQENGIFGGDAAGVPMSSSGSSQDRRKRRRITPDQDNASDQVQTLPRPKGTLTGMLTWEKLNRTLQSENMHDSTNTEPLPPVAVTKADIPKPKRGRPKFKKAEGTNEQRSRPTNLHMSLPTQARQYEDKDSAPSIATSQHGSSTLKKRNIKTHANGTLLSSPRASPKRSKAIKEMETRANPGHNIKMRNGRLVHSLPVCISYAQSTSRSQLAARINTILSPPMAPVKSVGPDSTAKTHPFFSGKPLPKAARPGAMSDTEESNRQTEHENEDSRTAQAPVAWKDIKFSNSRLVASRSVEGVLVIWPPRDLHHVGYDIRPSSRLYPNLAKAVSKSKAKSVQVADQEGVLRRYNNNLLNMSVTVDQAVTVKKHVMSASEAVRVVDRDLMIVRDHVAITNVRSRIKSGTCAFDRGQASEQTIWPSRYAPVTFEEVLQPSCGILHDWLKALAIHNVKSGTDQSNSSQKAGRSRRKRISKPRSELDDFIQDDEDDIQQSKTPNAILITGPTGCGKTAAIYAVAKQLGFEVFEIHPGMRRSAKDIFEKVGDMTQNHLVQGSHDDHGGSRDTPVPAASKGSDEEYESESKLSIEHGQRPMSSFFGAKPDRGKNKPSKPDEKTTKKEQKQSLILFEEVDILFEDDRAFWTGVQSLIDQSKRPVVLTCNDLSSVPLDELDLHAILTFVPPDDRVATEYLAYLAASEGHLIDRTALSALYASKAHDLRASITELNFWCQMTIGSRYGGLDWMLQSNNGKPQTNDAGERLRTFSQDAYRIGLDLLSEDIPDREERLGYMQEQLDLDVFDWCSNLDLPDVASSGDDPADLQDLADLLDARSCLAIFDTSITAVLAASILAQRNIKPTNDRHAISDLYISQRQKKAAALVDYLDAFEPLMEEKPIFPPSLGRLAPSLDFPSPPVAYDIAPYVRSIVNFDRRLEQHRDEISGSQGKTSRTTRAARAALEGGDKAKTRSERWFPKLLDFDRVLKTGNKWPEWYDGGPVQTPSSPSSSLVAEGIDDMKADAITE